MTQTETIYARASAPGRAGVCVYRISGTKVSAIASCLIDRPLKPRMAHLSLLRAMDGHVIDQALVLLFPGPQSFTGEDTLELHCHGSRAVEIDLYHSLQEMGARIAEAGEFTLRAMKNGKMDLPKVEALADLIDSETNQQKNWALGQIQGRLSEQILGWRALLLKILTPLAADIDFPDEGDIPAAIAANALPIIDQLIGELKHALRGAERSRQIRDGLLIVLVGPPNAGKSSLLNQLAGSEIAIVSDEPGTTRDVIEARLEIGGMLVTMADTAGLRELSENQIEKEGMRRTRIKAREADLRILVLDGEIVSRETISRQSLQDQYGLKEGDIILENKSDLRFDRAGMAIDPAIFDFTISAKTGSGIAELIDGLEQTVLNGHTGVTDSCLNRQRHVEAVTVAVSALERARNNVMAYPELAAEDLRLASRAFDRLVGAIDVEDVLGEIFSNFCVGK